MAAKSLQSVVITFPDPDAIASDRQFQELVQRVPTSLNNVESLNVQQNIQTLSTNNAPSGGVKGLLYVPELDSTDPCSNLSRQYIPQEATRISDLPKKGFGLIALAPWISPSCSLSFMDSDSQGSLLAFVFYTPDNKTDQPPPISSEVWNMNDGGQWKAAHPFPVYAIPGSTGDSLMNRLSLYSGNVTSAPFGQELLAAGVDSHDFVRIYTGIDTSSNSGTMPGLWMILLVVVASLGGALMLTSFLMHLIQRRRREVLRRGISSGEINLEALGIKRLTVPIDSIHKMPLFIYMCPQGSPPTELGNREDSDGDRSKTVEIPVINDLSTGLRVQPQMYQVQSQPSCPICLDDYEPLKTVIRELPCGHIFHPDCIDNFLSNHSSLCPMCKKSALPIGYCPEMVTNSMVRRERLTRRQRGNTEEPAANDWRGKIRQWYSRRRFDRSQHVSSFGLQTRRLHTSAVGMTDTPAGVGRQEIVELRSQELVGDMASTDELTEERQRPKWRRAISRVFPTL